MNAAGTPQAKRVLLDENIDHKLRFHLAGHGFEIQTVRYAGLRTLKNGKLLNAAEGDFDVLVALDKSIEYRNNFAGRKLSVLVVHSLSTRLADILPHLYDIARTMKAICPGEAIYVGYGVDLDEAARTARPR